MRKARHVGGRIVFCLVVCAFLGAPTCDQPFGPTTTGNGPVGKDYRAFGDSIAAGYKDGTFPGQIKSYVGYYADLAAADQGWTITYRGFTTSGETTPQIEARMRANLSALRSAEIVSWGAGGNDFLDARSDFYGDCDLAALDDALATWRGDWDTLIDTVEANAGTTADSAPKIVTTNVYYPNPFEDASRSCGGRTRFEHLLPRLLSAGDYMCSTAESRGWRCADAFAVMNCGQDASGNPDFDCPNKRWLQDLADQGICPRLDPGNAPYREPSMDPGCIQAHLDATGDWSAFQDPESVVVDGVPRDYMQGDDTHPNAAGHQALGASHHELGYDDTEGPQVEDSYSLCIDYQDNDGDGQDDCADSDCAAFCP